jgi:glycogen phosphorylase
MESKARKIAIHIRTPKKVVETHAHKKVRAHRHSHEHDTERAHAKIAREKEEALAKERARIAEEKELARIAEETARLKEQERALEEKIRKEQEATERLAREMEEARRAQEESARRHEEIERAKLRELQERAQELLSRKPHHIPITLSVVTPPPPPPPLRQAEAMVPAKLVVPKKPVVLEGIPVSGLSVAYFSMEMGLTSKLPTYAGGLGILAGDTMRSLADLGVDALGVTLLYRKGYFRQRFDDSGWQVEEDEHFDPLSTLILLPQIVEVHLEGRVVSVRAWMHKVSGVSGHVVPVLFLDTDLPQNISEDRAITSRLYAGDRRLRLMQEAVLGIAGVKMLQAIGATNVQKFHMNEGHAALLTLELYRGYRACEDPTREVRQRCVFTTHTPIAAGHDRFTRELVLSTLPDYIPSELHDRVFDQGDLNMTHLGMMFSSYVNGVAKRHGEVTRELFPGYHIESITNGVHAGTWVAPNMAELFDRYIPDWRTDAYHLRYAYSIPQDELWQAHQESKARMIEDIRIRLPHITLDPNVFTIGFARRATSYKRGNMLFSDIERLKHIATKFGGIQIVYAGKAHPEDRDGKLMMQHIMREMQSLAGTSVRAVYVPNYDMDLARSLVSGCDMWLNTPLRPLEASGTSGMKAAMNGVPQFSTLDGWWIEGHIEHVTGWSIGPHPEVAGNSTEGDDIHDMYTKLEYVILPVFMNDRYAWIAKMRSAIALNGSFFNTQRMVEQYVLGAYFK